MTNALRNKMPELVRKVAVAKDPAMIAAWCALLRWPARRLPLE